MKKYDGLSVDETDSPEKKTKNNNIDNENHISKPSFYWIGCYNTVLPSVTQYKFSELPQFIAIKYYIIIFFLDWNKKRIIVSIKNVL